MVHIVYAASTHPVLPQAVHPGSSSCSRQTHFYSVRGLQARVASRDSGVQGAITLSPRPPPLVSKVYVYTVAPNLLKGLIRLGALCLFSITVGPMLHAAFQLTSADATQILCTPGV